MAPGDSRPSRGPADHARVTRLAEAVGEGRPLPPVETWDPPYCGDIGLAIGRDGIWRRHGSPITREPLVRLFASILRKDEDGRHYLVTPVEKVDVAVACAPFLAVRVDREGDALVFTTNVGDRAVAGPERPLWVDTDPATGEPTPFVRVRGRLDALLTRAVFFELAEQTVERAGPDGATLGVESGGVFFPLGPAQASGS